MTEAPNRSHAVVAKRKAPKKSIDFFPTPFFATEALCNRLTALGERLDDKLCLEPAAGGGHMVEVLERHFKEVVARDLHDPGGVGYERQDFLNYLVDRNRYQWVITNPPYTLAEDFAHRAIHCSTVGVAFLCRTSFMEGQNRYKRLFAEYPPTEVLVFTRRVNFVWGELAPEDGKGGQMCFSWFIWRHKVRRRGHNHTRLLWLAPNEGLES